MVADHKKRNHIVVDAKEKPEGQAHARFKHGPKSCMGKELFQSEAFGGLLRFKIVDNLLDGFRRPHAVVGRCAPEAFFKPRGVLKPHGLPFAGKLLDILHRFLS